MVVWEPAPARLPTPALTFGLASPTTSRSANPIPEFVHDASTHRPCRHDTDLAVDRAHSCFNERNPYRHGRGHPQVRAAVRAWRSSS